jgi:hypothetical protein
LRAAKVLISIEDAIGVDINGNRKEIVIGSPIEEVQIMWLPTNNSAKTNRSIHRALAVYLQIMGFCESNGAGWTVFADVETELHQLASRI